MTDAPKFNLRNPAVKRIMQEMKEIKQDTSGDFIAEALETDIFEWHFVIRGPRDTEFEGGIYHGRILLPAEYPFKPPSFMMLSPNGRFETGVKICLSISSHHPEHWQPSWSVRTALTALIAFMPSPGAGALGALDFPKEERRAMAARSRLEAPRFGSAERQRVIDEMHGRMLAIAAQKDAERAAGAAAAQGSTDGEAGRAAEPAAAAGPSAEPAQGAGAQAASGQAEGAEGREAAEAAKSSGGEAGAEGTPAGRADAAAGPAVVTASVNAGGVRRPSSAGAAEAASSARSQAPSPEPSLAAPASAAPAPASAPAPPAAVAARPNGSSAGVAPVAAVPTAAPAAAGAAPGAARAALAGAVAGPTSTDHMLTALMWALYVGIGTILVRKVMGAMGVDLQDLMADLMQ